MLIFFFFFIAPAPTEIYTLSLHDALPICLETGKSLVEADRVAMARELLQRGKEKLVLPTDAVVARSEEHTSELQSLTNLVCRLLLEKKKTEWTDGSTRWSARHEVLKVMR